ncbi:MAG TPA: methylene-tetrahydromethanopterin dehydrogenase N-terminal domain-containing protein [Solirubrobacteraceae bacterium]|nr:methylene-tetrahydromethanopterin dehydrogenase N-terminal domain-containing protein [Solirubrobacteraceae bacterium]
MKKILIQLDTDEHPSTFDAIVAHDADVDSLLGYGGVSPEAVRGLVQSAFFTRGPRDLATLAVWVGGSSVGAGEEVLAEVQKAFFGPFRVSAMLDSNGCNTTAATTVARLARELDLTGRRAVVLGAGAVGLRAAALLVGEGCEVAVSAIPADRFGDRPYRRARGLSVGQERGLDVVEPADDGELATALAGASLVLAAGPAGVQVLPAAMWRDIDSIEVLADFNAAEPLGIEDTEAADDLAERDGKRVLGALAIGGPKMKVHKACVRRLFESNDAILDIDGVYAIAKELG